MSKTVFIIGAGASKDAGAPLMKDFLDRARRLRFEEPNEVSVDDFDRVFYAIGQLQQVHSKSDLDIVNLESVFSAFDMARVLKRMPNLDANECEALVPSLKKVIQQTLENTVLYRHDHSRILLPPPYDLLGERLDERRRRPCSFITFNYDLCLDHMLKRFNFRPNYFLNADTTDGTPLLKLHGSLNWGECENCHDVVAYDVDDYEFIRVSEAPLKLRLEREWNEFRHTKCDSPVKPEPVIIPPTWNKTPQVPAFHNVWARAAQELAEASTVIVIGYSLPETDLFFRYLYALGSASNVPFQRFWVFNPDDSGETEERFRRLLGLGALPRFRYEPCSFHRCIDQVSSVLSEKI